MATEDLAAQLGRTVLFNGLDEADLRRLAGIVREKALAAGEVLFDQGDESDGLYVVVSGIVRIFITADDGREATVFLSEEGEVIGEMALLDGLPRSAGAAALTDAKLVVIPRGPFLDLLDSTPKLARQIILTLCERLRSSNSQFDQAIFHDLRHRLLVLLRQIAVIHGHVEADMAVVELDITQGTLALMLGASREAVNKQLRALVKEGYLALDNHKIQIFKHPRS